MDARQYAPATQRNREPILEVLKEIISPESNILEIASGTGEHGIFFADQLKPCCWIPSDTNLQAIASITAWQKTSNLSNISSPLIIDVVQSAWTQQLQEKLPRKLQELLPNQTKDQIKNLEINAIININMIHISAWDACLGLLLGAARLLPSGGILYLYGPYKRGGQHTSSSNANFDLSLRDRNPHWGIKNLEDVVEAAAMVNLELQQVVEMPANNLSVIFRR